MTVRHERDKARPEDTLEIVGEMIEGALKAGRERRGHALIITAKLGN
jgi:hypothetical protein